MKKIHIAAVRNVCVAAGIVLLAAALVTLAIWRWQIDFSEKQAARYVQTLQTLLPAPQDAVPEERRDNTMAVLAVDGADFVGIIEMPRYGSVLPIGADWEQAAKYPCRFDGSVYNGTMQIGATTQKGQYDFYRELSLGDTVVCTDMEGNRYTFRITALRYVEHIDSAALGCEEAALVLFIKNIYAFEYLTVFCEVSN